MQKWKVYKNKTFTLVLWHWFCPIKRYHPFFLDCPSMISLNSLFIYLSFCLFGCQSFCLFFCRSILLVSGQLLFYSFEWSLTLKNIRSCFYFNHEQHPKFSGPSVVYDWYLFTSHPSSITNFPWPKKMK